MLRLYQEVYFDFNIQHFQEKLREEHAIEVIIEAGPSEKEAMEISGHRTRSVFDRYHIVSERRLRVDGYKVRGPPEGQRSVDEGRKRQVIDGIGEPGGTRTRDHRIKSAMLYQLSYRPMSGAPPTKPLL